MHPIEKSLAIGQDRETELGLKDIIEALEWLCAAMKDTVRGGFLISWKGTRWNHAISSKDTDRVQEKDAMEICSRSVWDAAIYGLMLVVLTILSPIAPNAGLFSLLSLFLSRSIC